MLRKKAAEELKKEQERKAAERRRIIEERCGKPRNVDDANEGILSFLFIHPFYILTEFVIFKLFAYFDFKLSEHRYRMIKVILMSIRYLYYSIFILQRKYSIQSIYLEESFIIDIISRIVDHLS